MTAKATLLCAIRFWGSSVPSERPPAAFRRAARHVARKQGYTPTELDRAERQLVRGGLVAKSGKRSGATLALTARGAQVAVRACPRVALPPWRAYPHHMPPGSKA